MSKGKLKLITTGDELLFHESACGLMFAANRSDVFGEINLSHSELSDLVDAGATIINDRDVNYIKGVFYNECASAEDRRRYTMAWEDADSLRGWLRRLEFDEIFKHSGWSYKMIEESDARRGEWIISDKILERWERA